MPPVGFEPTISGGERPQTYASDRAATGTGTQKTTPELLSYNLFLVLFVEVSLGMPDSFFKWLLLWACTRSTCVEVKVVYLPTKITVQFL